MKAKAETNIKIELSQNEVLILKNILSADSETYGEFKAKLFNILCSVL